MKSIIIGAGKVGYYLAKALLERNYDVSLIEKEKSVCQYFANTLDATVVLGDGSTVKALKKAGADRCDSVIAVTGEDEVNLVICQMAKKLFDVKKTIAKVNNPKNIDTMRFLGVDIAISGTDNIIKQMEREVDNSRIKELMPINGKTAVFEVIIPENFVYDGKMIVDIKLPDGCNIISITRGEELIIPRGRTKLLSNDKLLIVSLISVVNEVRKILKIKK
ncbi:MAG: TrkA family potassium uptake protein [Bacteroides sp.]|nr:TrkA family potassium uptake protein [Bacteroides sp.]